jgi:hypothetical protein
VYAQTFNNNLKELGVVESKRNTIGKEVVVIFYCSFRNKISCTSLLMHETRSCAHTLHKDRVSGVRVVVAEKVLWKKLSEGWTALNEMWRGTVGRKKGRMTKRGKHKRAS